MVVGVVIDNEFSGDPRVNNEVLLLSGSGLTVKVLCLTYGKTPEYQKVNGVEVFRLKIRKKVKNILFGIMNTLPFYHIWWQRKIHKFLVRESVEVLHAHDLYMARSASWAARRKGIKLILDLHENYPHAISDYKWANRFPSRYLVQPRKWKKLEGEYLNMADRIIVLSSDFKEHLSRKYGLPESIFTVYPNVPNISELLNYPVNLSILKKEGRFMLFYFGGISERRGILTCIESLRILKKEIPCITLLLIGPIDGAETSVFGRMLAAPEVKDRIIFIPWADIQFLPSYISVSDVCLSPLLKNPQHESGIANKVFQYMLFERPVIVSDCKPQAELIEECQCGMVFESGNPLSLAECIRILWQNPTLRAEMGRRGKEYVMAKYNESHFGENLLSLYRNL